MAVCGNNFPAPVDNDCEDCVQVVKTTKRVQIPCTRNTFKQYTVKVPRTVNERVARTVNFTEMEARTRQVPYTAHRNEERVRMEAQSFQVPVQKMNTRMVPVTRKVPKTIMVDVTTQEPRQFTQTVMECRTKQVPIKYTVQVPETKYRTETYQEPVQKSKVVYDNVQKTVYDTQVRTQCVPVTKMVTKSVPVYTVVARPAAPCPPGMDCGQNEALGPYNPGTQGAEGYNPGTQGAQGYNPGTQGAQGYNPGTQGAQGYNPGNQGGQGYNPGFGGAEYKNEFESLDKNNDGRIDFSEYAAARQGAAAAVGGAQGGYAAAAQGGQGYNAGAAAGGQGYNAGAAGGQGYNAGAAAGGQFNAGAAAGGQFNAGAAGGQGFNAGAASGGASAAQNCGPCASARAPSVNPSVVRSPSPGRRSARGDTASVRGGY